MSIKPVKREFVCVTGSGFELGKFSAQVTAQNGAKSAGNFGYVAKIGSDSYELFDVGNAESFDNAIHKIGADGRSRSSLIIHAVKFGLIAARDWCNYWEIKTGMKVG